MFTSIEDLKSFQKQLRPSNENCIYYYLNTIYQFLLMREESPGADINEVNSKNLFSNTLKQKANENGISMRNFLQYFDIQEFMCERVFKYLDKTKTGQLTKNEFVNGLDTIFYGNIQELYKMVFFMCDFNDKGKIHKFNMKLILSYIPVKTYEEQQKYIKNINSIIDHYFTDLDKRFPEKNIKVDKEIDFDIYKNDIEDYIKDKNNITNPNNKFNNNGAFLLFINLISYIYINNPFNRENMNFCKFLKNKFLMKVPKKPNKIENILNNNNSNTNNTNTNNTTNKEKDNNKNTINVNINENSDKDLQLKNKGKNRSNSLYNSKMKKNNHNVNTEKKQNNNELFDIHKKIVSTKELYLFNPSNKKALFSDVTKSDKEKNKDNKNTDFLAFSMNLNELKKEKLRSFRKEKNDNLTPPKNKKPELNLEQESDETKNNDYADILYKNCEEDSSKFIKKYYGELRGKDILFFTSKLKNELCTIWNISKCIIIPLEKINISKYNYFPIKFINYNQSFCLISKKKLVKVILV